MTRSTGYEFAGFRFDPVDGLRRAGRPIALPTRAQRALGALLARNGRVLSKDELVRAAWPNATPSDDSLARCVYLLRNALRHPEGIEIVATLYGRGYRLTVPVLQLQGERPSSAVKAATTASQTAFETLQVARQRYAGRRPGDILHAMEAMREALRREPTYVVGWTFLAECSISQAMRGFVPPRQAGRAAIDAAERALTLDPSESDGYAIRGWVRGAIERNFAAAFPDLDRAVELDPASWRTRVLRAWLLGTKGRFDAALDDADAAIEVNPLAPMVLVVRGRLLYLSGRHEEARAWLAECAAAAPTRDVVLADHAAMLARSGQTAEAMRAAVRAAALAGRTATMLLPLAAVLVLAGARDEAERVIAEVEAQRDVHPPGVMLAATYLLLDREADARAALERSRVEGCPWYGFAAHDPRVASLLSDERAVALQ